MGTGRTGPLGCLGYLLQLQMSFPFGEYAMRLNPPTPLPLCSWWLGYDNIWSTSCHVHLIPIGWSSPN